LFSTIGDTLSIGDYVGEMDDDESVRPVVRMELMKSGEHLDPRHWLSQTLEKQEKNTTKK
jgi:hypothetical protein